MTRLCAAVAVVVALVGVCEAAAQSVRGTVPQSVRGTVPRSVPGTVPQSVAGTVPQSVRGTVPEWVRGTVPQSVRGKVPGSVRGTHEKGRAAAYAKTCEACHGAEGKGGTAPALVPFTLELSELITIVRQGIGVMPGTPRDRVSDEEISAIRDYLMSLRN